MFYVKTKLANGVILRSEITNENVYTTCPLCGREHSIDLEDVLTDGGLYGTQVYCTKCSHKRKTAHR